MGVPTRSHIIDSLDWLDKTELGDKAATIARQAMQWAETGKSRATLRRFAADTARDPRHHYLLTARAFALNDVRGHYERVSVAFALMNIALETHGKEYVPAKKSFDSGFAYLNTGDTYAATIIYDYDSDTWRIASWGDLVEGREGKYV